MIKLAIHAGCDASDGHQQCFWPKCTCKFIPAAVRAAIKVMREPNEAMLRAYDGALRAYIESVPESERKWKTRRLGPRGLGRGYKISPAEKARCRWQAMLDAVADEYEETQ